MSRQPKQVHIYLYKMNVEGKYEFAIFQRSDNELWWQGICGGVEEGETIEESARREISEEAGITNEFPLYKLESKSYLPVSIFDEKYRKEWGEEISVIPMFFFVMKYNGPITISQEHIEFKWLTFEKADELVYFIDQKVALYELNRRLLADNLVYTT